MFSAIAPWIEQAASIVIAESRRGPTTAQQAQGGQHFLQRFLKTLRDRDAVNAGQHRRVQEKVERINVVVGGLLEMKTVGLHLPLALLHNDFPAPGLPATRGRKLRAKNSQKKQTHSLTEQMRVGRKIGGEIAVDMPPVAGQSLQPLVAKTGQPRGSFQQVI